MASETYPRDRLPHCRRCELPKDVCACQDARDYDRLWKRIMTKSITDRRVG